MSVALLGPDTRFALPPAASAAAPVEYEGRPRDDIRLLVAAPDRLEERRFADLADVLDPGDLVVVNTSPTLPAALDTTVDDLGRRTVHVSTQLDDGDWVVEVRRPANDGPERDLVPGQTLRLPGGVAARLRLPYPSAELVRPRLWRAEVAPRTPYAAHLRAHGRPIRYGYVERAFPLRDYQTVYARLDDPLGSAEMASAGRPFTAELLTRLVGRGVTMATISLHCGVASPEAHEPPLPERFEVPGRTADLVDLTRNRGGRVVAVGTTVVRAVESAALPDGRVVAAKGWTDLVLGRDRGPRVVDGLVSGLHEPEASHLLLLEAVAGAALVEAAYGVAVEGGYRWHEFGDSMLFLP